MSTRWPVPGAVALAQRGLRSDDGEERGDDVPEPAHGRADRRLPLGPLELVGAAHGLDDRGEGGPAGVGRVRCAGRDGMAEARDGEIDDRRVRRRHVVVAQPEALDGAGAEVLGDDVEARRQSQHEVASGRLFEVDDDRPLGQVVAEERRTDGASIGIGHGGRGGPAEVTGAGRFDLHHVGAEPSQELGGVGEGLHLLEGEDAHPVERLAPVRRLRD